MENAIKTALVMEGGAMRGMFTCGVIDVLMERNITFDGAIGISAGAVFGCNYKSKQIGRALRYNKAYCNDPRYCSISSLIKTGNLYGVDFCYDELPNKLDIFDKETFEKNPMEFYCGATDVKTGKPIYHKCIDGGKTDLKWLQASASMPFVSRPVHVDGHILLDGGVSDAVPYTFMENLGYNRNILILTRPKGYRKDKSKAAPIIRLMMLKYPQMAKAIENRYKMYNRQMDEIDQIEFTKKAIVIRPEIDLGIRRTESNPMELERVYNAGRLETLKRFSEIRGFLNI